MTYLDPRPKPQAPPDEPWYNIFLLPVYLLMFAGMLFVFIWIWAFEVIRGAFRQLVGK